MDGRLILQQADRLIRRRALSILARATGIIEPGLNPWYPDFTHAANGMTGYHSPEGTWGAAGSADECALANMRDLTKLAYAKKRDSEKRAKARTTKRPPPEVFVALTFGYIAQCRQGTPEEPWPRDFEKHAKRHAERALTDPADRKGTAQRMKALSKMTPSQQMRARAIAFEACFPVKAAERRTKKPSNSIGKILDH